MVHTVVMSENLEGAIWGTTKSHQLTAGDQVLVEIFRDTCYLAVKALRSNGQYKWKTFQELTGPLQFSRIVFTDGSSTTFGGVASRYYVRKAGQEVS